MASPKRIRRIAFLGIGIMGGHMARRLAGAGFEVTVWNRTRTKAEALSDVARVVDSAPAAVMGADCVVTMLADGPTVERVVIDEDLGVMARGALFIDMSSIEPERTRRMAARLSGLGARSMDAPVSGGEPGARDGRLAIMAGGDARDFAAAEPVFAALGRATHVGPIGTGQLAKLANQAIVGITIGAVSEALTLAAAGGADPERVRQAIGGGFAGSPILENHGRRMLAGDFAPGGLVTTQLKDMENALAAAAEAGVTLPLTARAREAYAALAGPLGLGDRDHAAYHLWLARGAASGPAAGAAGPRAGSVHDGRDAADEDADEPGARDDAAS